MKPRQLLIRILVVLFAIPLAGTVAQGATIEVIETFDYPGSLLTRPQKINDHGVIAGLFIDPTTGASEGFFFRSRSGRFSDPIIEPNDRHSFHGAAGR